MKKILFASFVGAAAYAFMLQPAAASQNSAIDSYPVFLGEANGDAAGFNLASAGDVNGDGYEDLIIGAYQNDDSGNSNAGTIYLVYGDSSLPSGQESLGGATVVQLTGSTANDYAGYAVAGGGDVNGDGYDDILIGAYGGESNAGDSGQAYLIYGQAATMTSGTLSARSAVLSGEAASNYAGRSVAFANLNGDAYDDIVIGADGNGDGGGSAGAAYIIYGQSTQFLSFGLSAGSVVQLTGESGAYFAGYDVANAGDVNADGYEDVLVGSYGYNTNPTTGVQAGAAYLVLGQSTNLSSASLSTKIRFTGENGSDQAGTAVSGVGDVDGNGYDDFVVSAPNQGTSPLNAGAAYLFYSTSTAWTSMSLGSDSIVKIAGLAAADNLGYGISGSGDVNNDGYNDLLLGATGSDLGASSGGVSHLLLGQADQYTDFTLGSDADSSYGLYGSTINDYVGRSVAAADTNNDGFQEILVGVYGLNTDATDAGGVYIQQMMIDADGDGVAGTSGLIDGVDCDDADANISEEVTYYADVDEDGMGDPDSTTSVCSTTAPEGYVDNDNDWLDSVANNGLENYTDGIDNDGDGEIDEFNTLSENGVHPGYGEFDLDNDNNYSNAVVSIARAKKGKVKVYFADDTAYKYRVYNKYNKSKKTKVRSYLDTGMIVVLHPKGKKVASLNAFNGEVLNRKVLSADQGYALSALKLLDVRTDGSTEVVVVSKQGDVVLISLLKVKLSTDKLRLKDQLSFISPNLSPKKTKVRKNKLIFRNAQGQELSSVKVAPDYTFQ